MTTAVKGDFTSNLGRIYTVYTGGFLGFVIFLYILERAGVSNTTIGYLFVAFTIAVYAAIGIMSRTMDTSEYYVAGRKVPSFYNGMATAADWMSAASFIGMAGTLYALGYDGLAFISRMDGRLCAGGDADRAVPAQVRLLHDPGLPGLPLRGQRGPHPRRHRAHELLLHLRGGADRGHGPDRRAPARHVVRDGGVRRPRRHPRLLDARRHARRHLDAGRPVYRADHRLPRSGGDALGQKFGLPIPQLTYGQVIAEITAREASMVQQGLATAGQIKPHVVPGFADGIGNDTQDWWNFFALVLCLMVGTASLPHVLMRYFTTPSVREARSSVAWTLLFIFILYFTAPAYAAFAKLEVFNDVIGKNIAQLPGWIYAYGKVGLVQVCGVNATDPGAVAAACQKIAGHAGILRFGDLRIDNDAIVISTPEIAGLPYVVAGLVAAGGLAAALSTADGLLLAIANALSHDIYSRMIDKNAPPERKLVIARVLLIGVAIIAAYVASGRPADIVAMVAWAFSLAAAGLFPALVLGIWWKRCTKQGAIAGIIAGFGMTLYYLVGTRYYAAGFYEMWSGLSGASQAAVARYAELKAAWMAAAEGPAKAAAWVAFDRQAQLVANWWGIRNISAAMFGLPVGFAVMIVVSLLTPAPSKQMQDFVDEVRKPKGKSLMGEEGAILGH